MCGRYAVYSGFQNPNYNASPGQFLPVMVSKDSKLQMALMRWGLVPSWAKDDKKSMINARAETISQKPMFKPLLKRSRCLVPADGFFEWGLRNNQKWPFFFKLKGDGLMAFAGLYSDWETPDGSPISTYTIITTNANSLVASVHNRMPSIIPKDKSDLWLDPHTPSNRLESLLRPVSPDLITYYPVSTQINTPGANDPSLINPLTPTP